MSVAMSWRVCYCCWLLASFATLPVLASNTRCPTWHFYNNSTGQCECGFWLHCSCGGNQVEIEKSVCVTSSEQEHDYYVGKCPFRHHFNNTNRKFSELPTNASELDEVMCGPYNRKGLLCGECKEGYGPAVYSMNLKCANCSEEFTIYFYLLLQFVPTLLIFTCLVVFRFNITSGPLLGYVLFCQISIGVAHRHHFPYEFIKSNISAPLEQLLLFSVTVSQFWSLQYFKAIIPPICISEKLTSIHVHMLNFIPATFPFILVIVSCILMELHARNYRIVVFLWKPFSNILSKTNITVNASNAVFHAFATCILLSNVSVLLAMYRLVDFTHVFNSKGVIKRCVLYIDPTVECFSHQCISYILIAAVPFISISVIPSVLLCLYPTKVYRYLSRYLSTRKQLAITAFAEALHSCFKDGLNGYHDYRALAGATLFILLFYSGVALLLINIGYYAPDILLEVVWLILVCAISFIKPCKSTIANISLSFHLTLFGILQYASYMWQYDLSVETYMLEVTFIALSITPHILLALWAGYTFTKLLPSKQVCCIKYKVTLNHIANCVRHCLRRKYVSYQEMHDRVE